MKRDLVAAIVCAAILGFAASAFAGWLPRQNPVPGGVAWVSLGPAVGSAPRAYLGGDRVMVLRQGEQWIAVVGVPLTLKPGAHELMLIDDADRMSTRRFLVRSKKYGAQHITMKDTAMVDPSGADLERIGRDQTAITEAFTHWSEADTALESFQLPVHGRLSGVFGTRRFFNEQERQPHNGVDIAAPRGTAVLAPAPGVVLGVGEYFFNGLTIFIDHGRGLISMYNHLDRALVAPGASVTRGQHIGDIGMTGRATGPHLHWGLSLNNTRIDPLLFVSKESIKQLVPPAAQTTGGGETPAR